MTADQQIRNAAGAMMRLMAKGHDATYAIAYASSHAPELTEEELRFAFRWAAAGVKFQQLSNAAPEGKTLRDLLEESGLYEFRSKYNG